MRKISDTISRLAALRAAGNANTFLPASSRLARLSNFGPNPGALNGYVYISQTLRTNAALVVVLHGCTQNAAGYDIGAGWSDMADRHGFALIFPEQQRQNNPNLCFNWFSPGDNRRDVGEALSIRQMVAAVTARHGLDPARVFVTGLSAGGAMTSVMLAAYPEVFAGGAIIAGLPYGCANTVPQAFDRMRGHGMPSGLELTALVRSASDYEGPWPTLSIWHGTADATVSHDNAQAIIDQWRTLHGARKAPDHLEAIGAHARRIWTDAAGREVIELYTIHGMGHGTPLDTLSADGCGASGPYLLEANISSTQRICHFWGLAHETETGAAKVAKQPALGPSDQEAAHDSISNAMPPIFARRPFAHDQQAHRTGGVRKVIEDALRSAGLMR
ncbi:alpha/beta hydrolase family esterase [Novosphingobium kaempferiae]|uniref:extracellular catalytic domain type 1 short-chain-length polyhydroxyalkanoate depolymerase n=1 Tax=Novosphingobium kaempferiae TaxID=2896849 RepID=UPI001E387845|nr:PHB depolymerase family esterase [Novosphingobium kaempferiae]